MKDYLKLIYYIVIGLLIMASLLLVASIVPISGFQIKSVMGGSMEPAISVGSIVIVRSAEEYLVGDIITFQFPNEMPITHRIYDLEEREDQLWFVTKGDANEEVDQRMVYERNIIGRVIFDIPYIGFVINFFQQPLGFILLIVVPATIIISDEIRNIMREITKLKERKKDIEQDKKIQKIEKRDNLQDDEIKDLRKAIMELRNEKSELKLKTKRYNQRKKMIKKEINKRGVS